MPSSITEWEQLEIQRSALEAAHAESLNLIADESQVRRYFNPPPDTCYPLEYAYHLLGDVRGKTVLDYGCGSGLNTLIMAKRGAQVKALDISPALIAIARQRLIVNHINSGVQFIVGSAHQLPLPDESVDVVFGMVILHHLDLSLSAREITRVLRKGGRAIFREPVRNSPLLQAARKLIPYQGAYVSALERPLTDQELSSFADGYSSFHSKAFLLPSTSVLKVFPLFRRFTDTYHRWDAALLRKLPSLNYYATFRVVEMVK